MKVIIIEDEKPSARRLQRMLHHLDIEAEVMLHSVEESIDWFQNNEHPDLIFLDIQLSDGLSFEIFESIDIQSAVIFTTAYEQYAVKAFKVSAVDYLLKPIDIEELKNTVQRIEQEMTQAWKQALERFKEEANKKLVIPHQTGITFLEENEIVCLEANRNYTEIHTKSDKKILVAKTLGDFEELLTTSSFFRAHRSFIINLQALEQWVNKEGGYLLMSNQLRVPLARNRRERFFKLIHAL